MSIRDSADDPERKPMLERIDAIIREVAGDSEEKYLFRMKQVASFATDRANGELSWPANAKRARIALHGEKCERCGVARPAGELQAHRVSKQWNNNRVRRCGYTPENVRALCQPCHDAAEKESEAVEDKPE